MEINSATHSLLKPLLGQRPSDACQHAFGLTHFKGGKGGLQSLHALHEGPLVRQQISVGLSWKRKGTGTSLLWASPHIS